MNLQELAAWLRLLLTPGVGNISARKLLAAFGLPDAVFIQSHATLTQVVSNNQARALLSEPPDFGALLDSTWSWLQADAARRRILTLGSELYPKILLSTEDPPLLLYAMGRPEAWSDNLLNSSPCIAVVGSRNPSPQGVANARQFSRALAEAGLTVVSGLALGVDGAAHKGALDCSDRDGLTTIAVVGTGLDRVYPQQHRELAHRIVQRGILLSEFALGTGPLAAHFPQRNRIISALSVGTLVVEAALQSGSLITARLAAEQGREVFAIPGSIHAPQSRGCHALIKQGAKLVETAQDVLEELHWEVSTMPATLDDTPWINGLEAAVEARAESVLLQALGYDACGLDALQARTGLPTPELLAQLMELELQGLVARLPGALYQRLGQA